MGDGGGGGGGGAKTPHKKICIGLIPDMVADMLEGNRVPFSPFPYIVQWNSFELHGHGLTSIAKYSVKLVKGEEG